MRARMCFSENGKIRQIAGGTVENYAAAWYNLEYAGALSRKGGRYGKAEHTPRGRGGGGSE